MEFLLLIIWILFIWYIISLSWFFSGLLSCSFQLRQNSLSFHFAHLLYEIRWNSYLVGTPLRGRPHAECPHTVCTCLCVFGCELEMRWYESCICAGCSVLAATTFLGGGTRQPVSRASSCSLASPQIRVRGSNRFHSFKCVLSPPQACHSAPEKKKNKTPTLRKHSQVQVAHKVY